MGCWTRRWPSALRSPTAGGGGLLEQRGQRRLDELARQLAVRLLLYSGGSGALRLYNERPSCGTAKRLPPTTAAAVTVTDSPRR